MGTMSMVMSSMSMPPKAGMAMGIMMSEPRPVEVRTGSRARMVVAVVMRQARTRRLPAWMMRVWISCFVLMFLSRKSCVR